MITCVVYCVHMYMPIFMFRCVGIKPICEHMPRVKHEPFQAIVNYIHLRGWDQIPYATFAWESDFPRAYTTCEERIKPIIPQYVKC